MSNKKFPLKPAVMTILGLILFNDTVLGHKCYICGTDIGLNCDNFNPNNNIFTKECAPNSQGCSIQKHDNGSIIMRSCEDYKLDDCKMANNVEYCYCSKNYCNDKFIYNKNNIGVSDDEDIIEGSGYKSTKIKIEENTIIPPPTSSGNTSQFKQILIFALYILTN